MGVGPRPTGGAPASSSPRPTIAGGRAPGAGIGEAGVTNR
jgi:hypothetical protein